MRVYTIGHSNRSIEEFLRLLRKYSIEAIADVRRFPTSKYEHFKAEKLKAYLERESIEYHWFEKLGGYRRKILDDSPNIAIKSEGFRNYADYMMTDEFKSEAEKLMDLARRKITAIMCAERFFWRCHRKFISDYLTIKGFEVLHIIDGETRKHKLSKEARIVGDNIVYDLVGD